MRTELDKDPTLFEVKKNLIHNVQHNLQAGLKHYQDIITMIGGNPIQEYMIVREVVISLLVKEMLVSSYGICAADETRPAEQSPERLVEMIRGRLHKLVDNDHSIEDIRAEVEQQMSQLQQSKL